MKHPPQRIQITEYDNYSLSRKEREIYRAILNETIIKNKRCAELSLSDIEKLTGIKRSTVDYNLKMLIQRRLIKIDNSGKTNSICIVSTYKEIYRCLM